MRKQPHHMSLVESLSNVAAGFGIATATNSLILPVFGFHVSLSQSASIAAIFTVVSIVRSYTLRRLFEALHVR